MTTLWIEIAAAWWFDAPFRYFLGGFLRADFYLTVWLTSFGLRASIQPNG
jgi:hypothetical protein